MKIQEAIKFIIDQKDDKLLTDSKRFNAYLKDLCSDNPKELKIINRALDDNILQTIFSNERENIKIAILKDEFEEQGMSQDWIDFIINSFIKPTNSQKSPAEQNLNDNESLITSYIEVTLNSDNIRQLFFLQKIDSIDKDEMTKADIPTTYKYRGKNYKVVGINDGAFENCKLLIDINIPDTVTTIGNNAFKNCANLEKIEIPNSVTKIKEGAFENCSALKDVTIPNTIKILESNIFTGCSSLKSIEIPNSVTEIGNCVFKDCSILKDVTIPDTVTKIGTSAFENCPSLTEIKLPDSIADIEPRCFYACSNLAEIEIPKKITSISAECFGDCKELKNITIPDGLTSIGESAFYNCISLTIIEIPDTVTLIDSYAFYNCTSLKLIIPESITEIGKFAFWDIPIIYYNGNATYSSWTENKYQSNNYNDVNWHAKERKTF